MSKKYYLLLIDRGSAVKVRIIEKGAYVAEAYPAPRFQAFLRKASPNLPRGGLGGGLLWGLFSRLPFAARCLFLGAADYSTLFPKYHSSTVDEGAQERVTPLTGRAAEAIPVTDSVEVANGSVPE